MQRHCVSLLVPGQWLKFCTSGRAASISVANNLNKLNFKRLCTSWQWYAWTDCTMVYIVSRDVATTRYDQDC